MYKASRINVDTAGGLVVGSGLQDFVTIEGELWAVQGDAVASHGDDEHAAAVMAEGSSFITINGIPVCRQGHLATCGDAATGSGCVEIED